jgi:hypothetical protein
VSAFCLLALTGALLWRSEAPQLTLRWTHSIEKTTWEEVWQRDAAGLVLTEARIEGSGAGMEPPPDARKEGRFWVWSPMLTIAEVNLAHSGAAGDWLLCPADGACLQPNEASRLTSCSN